MVHASVTPRARTRVVFGAGIDIEHARSDRIEVIDGGLQVSCAGTEPITVASAADVTQVVWLDGQQTAKIFSPSWRDTIAGLNRTTASILRRRVTPVWFASGSCVVLTCRGPVAAWLVDACAPGDGDASVKRTTSGSVAIARSLGVVLEPRPHDEPLDARAVRRVALRGTGERVWLTRFSLWGSIIALLLAALSFGGFDGDPVSGLAAASMVLSISLAVVSVVMRRRTLALVDQPLPPANRAAHPSTSARTQIQLDRDDVVLVLGDGTEYWLPGPDIVGGITQIEVVDDYLHFKNTAQEVIRIHPAAHFVTDDATCESLRAAAAHADVSVDVLIPPTVQRTAVQVSELTRYGWASGDVTIAQSWLLWPLAPMLFVAGAAATQDAQVLGRIVQVSAVFVLGCRIWCTWSLRRWIGKATRGDAR